jgi:hypothetical protein
MIEDARRHYLAGDHRAARRLAREALERAPGSDPIARQAREILRSTGIDPLAIAVFGLTLMVLVFLVFRYVL